MVVPSMDVTVGIGTLLLSGRGSTAVQAAFERVADIIDVEAQVVEPARVHVEQRFERQALRPAGMETADGPGEGLERGVEEVAGTGSGRGHRILLGEASVPLCQHDERGIEGIDTVAQKNRPGSWPGRICLEFQAQNEPWQCLNLRPDTHGQGALRETPTSNLGSIGRSRGSASATSPPRPASAPAAAKAPPMVPETCATASISPRTGAIWISLIEPKSGAGAGSCGRIWISTLLSWVITISRMSLKSFWN